MSRTITRLLFRSLLAGLLYGLSFPPFNYSSLAWFSLVPLLIPSENAWKPQFISGLLAGLTANLIIYFWFWKTFQAAEIGFLTTLGAWLMFSTLLSLYFAFFMVFYGKISHQWFSPWVAAALWVVLENIRGVILTGFPWALLGHLS